MTAWITCPRCHGAQTLAVQGEDYERECDACDGEGALLDDDAGEPETPEDVYAREYIARRARRTAFGVWASL